MEEDRGAWGSGFDQCVQPQPGSLEVQPGVYLLGRGDVRNPIPFKGSHETLLGWREPSASQLNAVDLHPEYQ